MSEFEFPDTKKVMGMYRVRPEVIMANRGVVQAMINKAYPRKARIL